MFISSVPVNYGLPGLEPVAVVIADEVLCPMCAPVVVRERRPVTASVIRWDYEAAPEAPGKCDRCGTPFGR